MSHKHQFGAFCDEIGKNRHETPEAVLRTVPIVIDYLRGEERLLEVLID